MDNSSSDDLPFRSKLVKWFRSHIHYYTIHFLWICILCLVGGAVIWNLETDPSTPDLSYVDALVMSTSAVCVTGLISVDPSQFSLGSQITLAILVQLGSSILGTLSLLLVRRHYFEKAFKEEILAKRIHMAVSGSDGSANLTFTQELQQMKNSTIEYLALGKLAKVVVMYVFGWEAFCCGILWIYTSEYSPVRQLLDQNEITPFWFSLFHSITAFNNAGLGLLSDNLMSFAQDRCVLLVLALVILLGNTAYPIVLRFITYMCHKRSKTPEDRKVWKYILQNPRQVYTHMFPAAQTRSLLLSFMGLNLFQLMVFISIEFNQTLSSTNFDLSDKFLIGFFQSIATRTAGFNVIDMSQTAAGVMVMDVALMYISSYPFILTFRQSSELNKPTALISDKIDDSNNNVATAGSDTTTADLTQITTTTASFDSATTTHRHSACAAAPSDTDTDDGLSVLPRRSMSSLDVRRSLDVILDKTWGVSEDRPRVSMDRRRTSLDKPRHMVKVSLPVGTAETADRERVSVDLAEMSTEMGSEYNPPAESPTVTRHVQQLLLRDSFWVFLAMFGICASQPWEFKHDPGFSIFKVVYEVISAYGTVGLTLGYPGTVVAFTGALNDFSKILIVLVMIVGRHRGLPSSVDPAVLPPRRRKEVPKNTRSTVIRRRTVIPQTPTRRPPAMVASPSPSMDSPSTELMPMGMQNLNSSAIHIDDS